MQKLLCSTLILFRLCISANSQVDNIALKTDTSDYAKELEEVVVTAQYRPTSIKKVLYNVEIIDAKMIERRGAISLDKALLFSSLLRLETDPILGTSVRMRGISENNIGVLVDGVPIIGRNDGKIDLSQISLQNIERIEIISGPVSNVYGTNSAGGVINLISKKSQLKKWALEGNLLKESICLSNINSTIGYSNKKLLVRGFGRLFKYDQYPSDSLRVIEKKVGNNGIQYETFKYVWNPKKQSGLGTLIRYLINNDNSVLFKADYNNEDVVKYGSIKRPKFKPYANDIFFNTKRIDYSVHYQGKIKNIFIDAQSSINSFNRINNEKIYQLDSNKYDKMELPSSKNIFISVINRISISKAINKNFDVILGSVHQYDKGSGDRLKYLENSTVSIREIAFYSELKFKLKNGTSFALSGRNTNNQNFGNYFTPSFMYKYEFNNNFSIKSSLSKGYRSPSMKELYLEFIDINHYIIGYDKLQPEISNDIQLTLQYKISPQLDFTLNFYNTSITDRIQLTEYEPLKYSYRNIDSYIVKGIQFSNSLKWKSITNSVNTSIGYWDSGIEQNSKRLFGNVIDLSNTMDIALNKLNMSLLLSYRHVGKQPIYSLDNDQVVFSTISALNYLDFSINKSLLQSKLKCNFGVKNILNVKESLIRGSSIGGAHSSSDSRVVSQGRSYFLSLIFNIN